MGRSLGDICSFGTARRTQALPCPSTGTRSDCGFLDFQHACARGGGYYTSFSGRDAVT